MSTRARFYVILGGLGVGLGVVGLVLYSLSWPELEAVVEQPLWLLQTPEPLVTLFALAGIVIMTRREDNSVGRLLIQIGFLSGFFVFATGYSLYAQLTAGWAGGWLACWVGTWAWFPVFALLVTRLLLVFPDGAPPSPRWRHISRIGTGIVAVGTLAAAMQPAGSANLPVPMACWTPPMTIGGPVLGLALVATVVLGVVALLALVRKAQVGGTVIRAQIKWFALAMGLLVFSVAGRELVSPGSGSHIALVVLSMVAVVGVPAAIGVAILRYRLYDIDRIVSRTVSYALMTALLGGLFVISVILLRAVFPWEGQLPVAVSTLAVAALFNPLRSRIQKAVDRRFNRSRYDAERTVFDFERSLRSSERVDRVDHRLKETVATVLEPAYVSLWLNEEPSHKARTSSIVGRLRPGGGAFERRTGQRRQRNDGGEGNVEQSDGPLYAV